MVGTYKDAGISGASMILRPGIQMLLQDAQTGQFDIVLAEALDRISRDQADVATLFKHLKFAGVKRGTGLVNNKLYIGRLIWNRLRYLKDPSTGRRVSRLNPESEWIVKDVPDLRIVDDELWQAVRARQGEIAEKFANVTEAVRTHHKKIRLNGARGVRSRCCRGWCSAAAAAVPIRCAALIASPARTISARVPAPTAGALLAKIWSGACLPD